VSELRGGLIVADAAIALAIRLEAAGHRLSVAEGKLVVSDGTRLIAEDRAAIPALRWHLMAIAEYRTEAP
jgi:hypothetical protein